MLKWFCHLKCTTPPKGKCLEDMLFTNISKAQFVTKVPECFNNLTVVVLADMGLPGSQHSKGHMAALNPESKLRILSMMGSTGN